MKFRCEDKRSAQLEDLKSTTESHRTVITSSGFVSTVHSINLYFFFSLYNSPTSPLVHIKKYVSDIPYHINERQMKKQSETQLVQM